MYQSKQIKVLYFKCKGSRNGFRPMQMFTELCPNMPLSCLLPFLCRLPSNLKPPFFDSERLTSEHPVTSGHPVSFRSKHRYDPGLPGPKPHSLPTVAQWEQCWQGANDFYAGAKALKDIKDSGMQLHVQ